MNKWLPILALIGLACLVLGIYLVIRKPEPLKEEPRVTRQVIVPANQMWIDTGIDTTGKTVTVRYVAGTWTNGGTEPLWNDAKGGGTWENLIVPGAPIRALVGKTDEGVFFVGNLHEVKGAHGHLKLSMNDVADKFSDNQGSITVSITQ